MIKLTPSYYLTDELGDTPRIVHRQTGAEHGPEVMEIVEKYKKMGRCQKTNENDHRTRKQQQPQNSHHRQRGWRTLAVGSSNQLLRIPGMGNQRGPLRLRILNPLILLPHGCCRGTA